MNSSAVMSASAAALVTTSARSAARSIVNRVVFGLLISEDSLADDCCQMELSESIGNGQPDVSGSPVPALQLQCVWCDKNYLWYSVGLPLVSLVRVGLLGIRRNSSKRSNAAWCV